MPILIDGYNLLNAVGVEEPRGGRGSLERARTALLNFLAASIDPADLAHTTVVFDAQDAPPGVPRELRHRGLLVRFAPRDEDADSLIEELILADHAPKQLTVVSSDHRIQRAAKRRRARAVDSEVWYLEIIRSRKQRNAAAEERAERPSGPLLDEDVQYWLREFGEK